VLDTNYQPGLEALIEGMQRELNAKAALLLLESGQIQYSCGEMHESDYPSMAALIAAMIATGKSLGSIGDSFSTPPTRFSCDSDTLGLAVVEVTEGMWLAALYDQPLNPALYRHRLKICADRCAGFLRPLPPAQKRDALFSATSGASTGSPEPSAKPSPSSKIPGAKATPAFTKIPPHNVKVTDPSSLFTNITDDEIDRLFENNEG